MRILLHACCGPCLLEPYDDLSSGSEVDVCFANPNIHSDEEYARRFETLERYARERGIRVIEVAPDHEAWEAAVAGTQGDRARRCRVCYRHRIGLAAREAVAGGYDAVATTLGVSPYQDHEALAEEGAAVCAAAGVAFRYVDWRDRYAEATRRSRELGMYRQDHCGCGYSIGEAETDRAERRERRRRERRGRGPGRGGD